jgi:hypothetical protein
MYSGVNFFLCKHHIISNIILFLQMCDGGKVKIRPQLLDFKKLVDIRALYKVIKELTMQLLECKT